TPRNTVGTLSKGSFTFRSTRPTDSIVGRSIWILSVVFFVPILPVTVRITSFVGVGIDWPALSLASVARVYTGVAGAAGAHAATIRLIRAMPRVFALNLENDGENN